MLMLSSRTSGAMYLSDNTRQRRSLLLGPGTQIKGNTVSTGSQWEAPFDRSTSLWLEEIYVHRPFSAHSLIRGNINGVCAGVMAHSQAQVSDGTGTVLLHQDIL